MITRYPSPLGGEEFALAFDRARERRLLVLPALFDEGNKLRHFTVEIMRRLDRAGIDSFLPDLPGCNESLASLQEQTLATWREAAVAAAHAFAANQVLTVRGGALCAPETLPIVRYAAVTGASLLRGLLRARIIASKEAGRDETREGLLTLGRSAGLELAGYRLGRDMLSELEAAEPESGEPVLEIAQSDLGGPGLWLRAEPAHDADQADALAARVAEVLAA